MNPSINQVESSLFAMQKHFEKEAKSLERYAAKPEAKQSYIDERNLELAKLANSITIIEEYINSTRCSIPIACA
jgi:peptidoglycan hydrolase CwlO-like protein